MELIVDLHIHSHYSRATSKDMNIAALYRWAKIKGINIIGTGDFTHPAWFSELTEKLELTDGGLYSLKKEYSDKEDEGLPSIFKNNIVRFVPTVEISNIFKKNGKVRKLHNLIVAPDLKIASLINSRLSLLGNIRSDGRPILGLDSKELLKIALDSNENCLFIPAHIWTPWFSMFGSKSGFNSIEEAFEEESQNIYAIETGLSSDPFMNWRIKELQGKTILSNSDAHSPAKLGREANILNIETSYKDLMGAIKTHDERFKGTIEFFPEEGKYHYDGHRLCNISLHPSESKKINNVCPVCNQELTLGVDHRIEELAELPENYKHKSDKTVEYIVPLIEIVAEVLKSSTISKKTKEAYENLVFNLGDEFNLLRKIKLDEFDRFGIPNLSMAINKMRSGDIYIKPGFDGVYGIVNIFGLNEKNKISRQMEIF